jgi:hypothetical protein
MFRITEIISDILAYETLKNRQWLCLTPRCALPYVSLVATGVLESMMETICERRALHRRHLHILLQKQLQKLTLSFGIGDAYHGFEFMKERCKVTIKHVQDSEKVLMIDNTFKSSSNKSMIFLNDVIPLCCL